MSDSYDDMQVRIREQTQALRVSEAKFRRLVEGLRDEYFFYTHGTDGVFNYVSPSIRNVLGYSQEDFLTHYTEFMTDAPENELVVHYTDLALQGLQQAAYEVEILHRDGTPRRLEVSETPLFDDNGKVVAVEGIARDITRRKEVEKEMLDARSLAEEASRAKGKFLANMSHELRTPLNAILGYSEMLEKELGENSAEKFIPDIRKIHAAGKHLLALINDVLDISKIEAGKMQLHPESFDLHTLIEEVMSTVGPLAEENRNELVSQISADKTLMRTDQTKLRQTLFNLLSNACKFTEDGRIQLDVESIRRNEEPWVSISVSDTGIGIPESKLENLFKAFSQVDSSTTRKFGGTGLGLAISRHYCQMMGGDLNVVSRVEKGSKFTLRLPIRLSGPPSEA